ncbi:hypothetical protein [Corynebacterium doosanense]|uniref:Uncharacterized protein n=1 Tax=Corynebacterium doosanense CAU 212 = DSM 45436 TaxID=558173 RepID=A0A097IJD2_9CORY|nr:hypothetical protein [Corynebacterium doosanense]AIT62229.1 hypothetical protein CDOO_03860 [Corynebacterium doosanense CAU 212 = DSM 45436]
MATKQKVNAAVKRLRDQQQALADAQRREDEERQAVLVALGEVLEAAATSPRSRWHGFRDRPLRDLLVEAGLEEAEETAETEVVPEAEAEAEEQGSSEEAADSPVEDASVQSEAPAPASDWG